MPNIDIKVYRRGDKRLIDVAQGALLSQCLVEEMASQFKPKPGSPARSQGPITPGLFGENERGGQETQIRQSWWSNSYPRLE